MTHDRLPVSVSGIVKHGKKLGRTLGFPTANLIPDESLDVTFGVYAAKVNTPIGEFIGMTNVGTQPTLPAGYVTVETYILDANPNLYDAVITVTLMEFIRPEQKFDGVDGLIAQLKRDEQTVRDYFGA